MAIEITLENGSIVKVHTATKKDDNYLDEAKAILDKTPRPLGNKLYAIMPDRTSDDYADYVGACKMIKAERIIPPRVIKAMKSLNLLEKTIANVKLVSIDEAQGLNISNAIKEYAERVDVAVASNVSNQSKEASAITFKM